jgi:GNAT superfamily N-acetyltransferase
VSEPRLYTLAERPDFIDRLTLVKDEWPEFMLHGNVAKALWRELRAWSMDFQWVLHDEEADEVVGLGNSIPLFWDGDVEHLPEGFDAVLQASVRQHAEGRAPNTLSALQAAAAVKHRGRGLSGLLIQAMRTVAGAHGFEHLIAPVRPTWKDRYPLVPIERYMTWRRDDGLPFDPWLRLHERLGGRMLAPSPGSTRITGTVAEWESWTGMAFPDPRRVRGAPRAGARSDRPRARHRRALSSPTSGFGTTRCEPDGAVLSGSR